MRCFLEMEKGGRREGGGRMTRHQVASIDELGEEVEGFRGGQLLRVGGSVMLLGEW
jgi:hypothetical protein